MFPVGDSSCRTLIACMCVCVCVSVYVCVCVSADISLNCAKNDGFSWNCVGMLGVTMSRMYKILVTNQLYFLHQNEVNNFKKSGNAKSC